MKVINEFKIKEKSNEIILSKKNSKISFIKINENVLINNKILLEKNDKIKIIESYNFEDIINIANHKWANA